MTVDTEEEFDWGKPLSRTGHSLNHLPKLAKFQEFCEEFGIVPIYLIDYPVACDPAVVAALGDAVSAGRAEVGVQLHPWVSAPHDEEVTNHNSYAGNLAPELEAAKFALLHAAITTAFGTAPKIYRAGRYGIGPATAEILSDFGVANDTSVRARFDYSTGGGPNFCDHPVVPWWIDKPGGLLELPLTTVFWGILRRQGHWLYPRMWRTPRMRGLLARMGLLERIPLTPEGVSMPEAIKGIDIAIDEGLPLLVFSFHSPSLAPGHTPYVRTQDELELLYAWWRGVFEYLQRRNIKPACVREILAATQT